MNKNLKIRHPEKLNKNAVPVPKKPSWIKVKAPLTNIGGSMRGVA